MHSPCSFCLLNDPGASPCGPVWQAWPLLLGSMSNELSFQWQSSPDQLTSSYLHKNKSQSTFKNSPPGFPGGTVVENLPANAGDTGSSPGLGRSHVPQNSWAREPQLLSLRVWSLCSAAREAAIVRGLCTAMKSGPRSPQLGKALAQKRRPNTAINK